MNQLKYIKKAEEILQDIEIKNLGDIVRVKHEFDFIVQYPPPLTLKPIVEETIYL